MSLSDKRDPRLSLNPGSTHRVKPLSACKCLLWTALIFGVCFVCLVALFIVSIAVNAIDTLRHPHKALYQNQTLVDAANVIRPLVDGEQTFDIAASVWVRLTEEEERAHKELHANNREGDHGQGEAATTSTPNESVIQYIPLFSDIVFSNLRLSEKGISTIINFTLPTARL